MDKQESKTNQSASNSQPIMKFAQRVSEWTKHFFTLTEEEKDAAGICGYKKENL